MQSQAKTPDQYINDLPDDRRDAVAAVRKVVLENLPAGYEEMIDFGMISYGIPLSTFPNTYNGHPLSIAAIASQKNYNSLYLMSVYGHPATRKWFEDAFKKSGKKLDMGKSCVRFKTVDDLPLDVIAQAIARVTPDQYIAYYQQVRGSTMKTPSKSKAAQKKPAGQTKPPQTKPPAKKGAAKKRSAAKSKRAAKKTAKKTAKAATKTAAKRGAKRAAKRAAKRSAK